MKNHAKPFRSSPQREESFIRLEFRWTKGLFKCFEKMATQITDGIADVMQLAKTVFKSFFPWV